MNWAKFGTAFTWALLQALYLVFAHFQSRLRLQLTFATVAGVAGSIAAQGLFGIAIDRTFDKSVLRRVIGGTGLGLSLLADAYLLATHSSFDPSLAVATWQMAFSPEAVASILGTFSDPATVAFLALGIALMLLHFVCSARSRPLLSRPQSLFAVLTGLLLLLSPLARGYNELATLIALVAHDVTTPQQAVAASENPFPLVHSETPEPELMRSAPARVPVVLLLIESFNARFVERDLDGQSVTPTFNALIKRGVYVEQFYGNSIQTSRGQFAALYGLPPVSKGAIFKRNLATNLRGLPDILRDHGYQTVFLQAYGDINLEGTRDFFTQHGFERVEAPFQEKPGDTAFVWGWGPEDHLFYRDAFSRLDTLNDGVRPQFVTLATISTHMRFRVPPNRRKLFSDPVNAEQRYANALHLADADLEALLGEIRKRPNLRDALILITGDHSFPTGQHGIEFNEVGTFEESFRTPLLILWPGHLSEQRLRNLEASQLDIPPTVLQLLGIPYTQSHFLGQSLWSTRPRAAVPLFQPYNGEYWGAIKDRKKLLVRQRTGERSYFSILADGTEAPEPASTQEPHPELLRTVNSLAVVRAALEQDAVWPKDGLN